MPPDVASEEEERYFGPPDQHDVGDDEEMATALWAHREQVRRLERFIQEFDDLASMDGQDISDALAELPVPQRGDVPTMSMQEALEVCSVTDYIIWYIICLWTFYGVCWSMLLSYG